MLPQGATRTQYKVSDFLNWQRNGLLVLSPKFQRRSVWSAGAKSYLLDTITKGFPIPIIFLREQKTDLKTLEHKREVVDGQQRIRTILSFVAPASLGKEYDPARDSFQIKATHNTALAGKNFDEFAADIKQTILDYEFSVHVLPSSIDDRQVVQIFARMNSTGFKLNDQELRNARYFGEFKTSMFRLAAEQLYRWREWDVFSWDNIARMQEVEITSEIAQLMLNGIVGKSQRSLDALYDTKDVNFPERKEIERRFQNVMDLIEEQCGGNVSKTIFCKRAPFYGLIAVVYDAAYGLGTKIKKAKPRRLPPDFSQRVNAVSELIRNGNVSKKVLEALGRRTTHPGSRRAVFNFLKRRLIGAEA